MKYRRGSMRWRNLGTGAVETARSVGEVVVTDERIVVEHIFVPDWEEPYRYVIDRKSGKGHWFCGRRTGKLTAACRTRATSSFWPCAVLWSWDLP